MRKKHISTEIFTYVTIGFLLIILLLCGIFLRYQKGIVQEKVNTSITGIMNQTTDSIREKLERTEALVRYLKLNTTLITILKRTPDYADYKTVDKLIRDMNNSWMWSEEYITIVGENGHIFYNWDNDGARRYSEGIKALCARLDDDMDVLYSLPFERLVRYDNIDQYSKDKKLIGGTSFILDYNYEGDAIGIVTVGVPEQIFMDIMEQNRIFEESEVCILDKQGNILLSTGPEKSGTTVNLAETGIDWEDDMVGNRIVELDGKKMVAFYQTLDSNWMQMLLIPYHAYMSETRLMLLTFAAVAVVAVFLALVISFLISYSLSKPIKELEASIDQITGGDLGNRVRVTRTDDIGKLGVHFNAMADNLEHLIEERTESQKRTSELIIASKTAELKMLHAQMNPHFLFNTLNSIRCLAIINKADYLAHMLESLGALLENSIMKGQENTLIGQEVLLLQKYIELQQMRYGRRLKAEFSVDEEIYQDEIPRFMLQPLVENAIIHGISGKIEGGTIIVRGSRQMDLVRLEVEDDGLGMGNSSAPSGHGVGIANIEERLHLIYGEHCSLTIESGREGKGTLAVMVFPEKRYEEETHD